MNARSVTHSGTVRAEARLPPGPRGYPLVGNALPMLRHPLPFLLACTRRYGDVVRLRMPVLGPAYLVNHPDGIARVLQENARNYDKDVADYRILKLFLGEGLLTSEGERWLRQRRLIQPAFHRKQIASMVALMGERTEALMTAWDRAAENRIVDMAAAMGALTLEIVSLALFGADLRAEARIVGEAVTIMNAAVARFQSFPFPPLDAPTPGNRRMREASGVLLDVVRRIIAKQHEGAGGGGVLALLLQARDAETGQGMDDEQLLDEVITLLVAGHETTANALAWTWYLLATYPAAEQRLHAELRESLGGRAPEADDLPRLPYTRAVIEESIRLYPPAWGFTRHAIADDEIGGYHVPAGTAIILCPYTTQRHLALWERPARFDPARFLGDPAARPHYAYFPFGGGQRQCIGSAFALTEACVVLATIAQRYRFAVRSRQWVVPQALITLRPRGGLPMMRLRR